MNLHRRTKRKLQRSYKTGCLKYLFNTRTRLVSGLSIKTTNGKLLYDNILVNCQDNTSYNLYEKYKVICERSNNL